MHVLNEVNIWYCRSSSRLVSFIMVTVSSCLYVISNYIWINLQDWIFGCCLLPDSCWLLSWLTFQPWWWRQYVFPNYQWISAWLHGIEFWKIVIFIIHDVETSNPTLFLCLPDMNMAGTPACLFSDSVLLF